MKQETTYLILPDREQLVQTTTTQAVEAAETDAVDTETTTAEERQQVSLQGKYRR